MDTSTTIDNYLLERIRQVRISLCSDEINAPIDQLIESGMVPVLIELLAIDNFPQLQFEAAWALTNIAYGTQENTQVVIDHGAVPVLVNLLSSPDNSVCEQAMWALCNISNDSPDFADLVLSHGALIPLLAKLKTTAGDIKIATWLLSNLCRCNLQPDVKLQALAALARVVMELDGEDVLRHACLALTYLSDVRKYNVQDVIDLGICERLVKLLLHPSPSVLVSALRVVGNIAAGNEIQTQCIIDLGVLPNLLSVLTREHNTTNIKKETCWAISNITAGNIEQKQAVIDAGLIVPLVNLLKTAELEVMKDAAWAITNVTDRATREQIMYLVNQDCVQTLCNLLLFPDPKVVSECLSALMKILDVGEANKWETFGVNDFAVITEKAEGLDKIIRLQNHEDDQIYEKCVEILEKYWNADGNGWWKCEIPEHCRSVYFYFQ